MFQDIFIDLLFTAIQNPVEQKGKAFYLSRNFSFDFLIKFFIIKESSDKRKFVFERKGFLGDLRKFKYLILVPFLMHWEGTAHENGRFKFFSRGERLRHVWKVIDQDFLVVKGVLGLIFYLSLWVGLASLTFIFSENFQNEINPQIPQNRRISAMVSVSCWV